jgi:outer membrane protein TolC
MFVFNNACDYISTIAFQKKLFKNFELHKEIYKEVKKATVRYAETKKNIPTFLKNVELAQNHYKIIKSRYDNDFALISDMVDAEVQLNSAKISLINANLDLIIQFYSLKYAMGKL